MDGIEKKKVQQQLENILRDLLFFCVMLYIVYVVFCFMLHFSVSFVFPCRVNQDFQDCLALQ